MAHPRYSDHDYCIRFNSASTVRVLATTITNIRRLILVPAETFYRNVITEGVNFAKVVPFLPYYSDNLPDGVLSDLSGEYVFAPDLTSLRRLAHVNSHSIVFGFYRTKLGEPLPTICPRTALLSAVDYAKDEYDLDIKVGLEIEFQMVTSILKNPVSNHSFAEANGIYEKLGYLDELQKILLKMDIPVTAIHCGSADGQYVVTLAPDDPLTAVDKLVLARETIMELARSRAMIATLVPLLNPDQAGNGQHVYVSIWKNGRNLFRSSLIRDEQLYGTVGSIAQQFIAGILSHVRALSVLFQPTANSFSRVRANNTSGSYACWMIDHREAAIRLCEEASTTSDGRKFTNVEVRCVDGTSNPYFAVAAIIRAGLHGITARMTLCSPASGYHPNALPLPQNREAALRLFAQDSVAAELLGMDGVAAFCGLQRAEMAFTAKKTEAQQASIIMDHF